MSKKKLEKSLKRLERELQIVNKKLDALLPSNGLDNPGPEPQGPLPIEINMVDHMGEPESKNEYIDSLRDKSQKYGYRG